MNRKMLLPLMSCAGAVVMVGLVSAAGEEQKVALDAIPAAARAALTELAGGAAIKEVEQETEDGVTIYEAAWMLNGVEHEACVTADGALLAVEETVPLAQTPTAVQAVVAKHFGSAKVVVEKKTIVVYEIEGEVNGKAHELLVLPTGKIHGDGDDDEHEGHHEHDED